VAREPVQTVVEIIDHQVLQIAVTLRNLLV